MLMNINVEMKNDSFESSDRQSWLVSYFSVGFIYLSLECVMTENRQNRLFPFHYPRKRKGNSFH